MAKKDDLNFEEAVFGAFEAGDDSYVELLLGQKIFFVVIGITLFFIAVALGRILYLNVVGGEFYGSRASFNVNKETNLPSERGAILDRNRVALVKNEPVWSVFLDVGGFIKKDEALQGELIRDLQAILGETDSGESISSIIKAADFEQSPRLALMRGIDTDTAIALRGLNDVAIKIENDYRRSYIYGASLAHVLGYTGIGSSSRIIEGKNGLESYYNNYLRGKDGKYVEGRDAKGRVLFSRIEAEAIPGAELHTTIDAELQQYFYNSMRLGLENLGRNTGAGIILNPQTGEILSLASFPSYDNNLFTLPKKSAERARILTSPHKPMFNRAISGVYSPGSTFKPLVALAGLYEKVMDPVFSVFSMGYLEIPNPFDATHPSRFLDWKPHGWVNLYSALARSSNVYFYTIGGGFQDKKGLGVVRIQDYFNKFGFGEKTGVDLPSEARGFFYGPDERETRTGRIWRIGDTYNVSIGQGDLGVTPLRLLSFTGAIGMGGKIKQPYIVSEVRDAQGNTLEKFLPKDIVDFTYLAPEILEVQKGLRAAVNTPDGTAHDLGNLPMSVAGKTGSAQILSNTKVNAFFVGYAPSENPELAILVLVEDAKEGSMNTVPIVKDVLRWYYEHRMAGRGQAISYKR